jgi:hypothetical protein
MLELYASARSSDFQIPRWEMRVIMNRAFPHATELSILLLILANPPRFESGKKGKGELSNGASFAV